jgi:hypothetical protein
LSDIYNVIKHVETNNNPNAVGDDGKAYGVVQIHLGAILDVNRIYGTDYIHEDAFHEECSEEIFYRYISYGIAIYIQNHNTRPTEEEIVRMWNGGIYRGYKIKSTKKYWNRYLKFKTLLDVKKN